MVTDNTGCIDENGNTRDRAIKVSSTSATEAPFMTGHLTGAGDAVADAERRIKALLDAHAEWLFSKDGASVGRSSTSLRKEELELRIEHGRLMLFCLTEEGARLWRINSWEWTGEKLQLEASARMGRESARLELIPRASASAIVAGISAARRERAERMARLACSALTGAKVERVGLSAGAHRGQPGRYARILLRRSARERIAVAGTVADADTQDADALLSSALIWFTRISERVRRAPYVQRLWLVVEKSCARATLVRLALLRDDLRRSITLFELDEKWQTLTEVDQLKLSELWREDAPRLRFPAETRMSEMGAHLLSLAPGAIDFVRARHGETLRYHGLAFARVRRVMNRERIWFGVDSARRILLDDSMRPEWEKLLRELQEHRRADAGDHQHALYRAAPEAWLESLLRRDITKLDPGLRLAPLHAQFRTSETKGASINAARPVDLLALRRDGRLVVIELKVAEDREHVLQGADYWRRISTHHRAGNIARARLFGDVEISDEPPLVYLVAPMLRFHRAFTTLARAINPQIELYRFDINEDWRTGVRAMRRTRVS